MTAHRCGRGVQEGVELGLIQEADLRVVVVGRRRLVDGAARVGMGPPLRDRELEDSVEVDVQVPDGLHRQFRKPTIAAILNVEAGVDEFLDVIRPDLVDRRLTEVRREVNSDLRLVVGKRRVRLATAAREVLDAPIAHLGDGHSLGHRRWRRVRLQHQLAKAGLGLRASETVASPGLAHRSERPLHELSAEVPLAVPATALLEHSSGAAGTARSRCSGPTWLLVAHNLSDAIDRLGGHPPEQGELIGVGSGRTFHGRRLAGTPRSRESTHASIDSRRNLTARPSRMCGSRPARTSR